MKIEQVSLVNIQDKISQHLRTRLDKLNSDCGGLLLLYLKDKGYGTSQHSFIPKFTVCTKMKPAVLTLLIFEIEQTTFLSDALGSKATKGDLYCSQLYRVPSLAMFGGHMLKYKENCFHLDCSSSQATLQSALSIVDALVENLKSTIDAIWQQIATDPIQRSNHP